MDAGVGYGLALYGGRFTGTPHRRLVAMRDPARGGETVIGLLVERNGRRTLRALDERIPERTVESGTKPTSGASWCSRAAIETGSILGG